MILKYFLNPGEVPSDTVQGLGTERHDQTELWRRGVSSGLGVLKRSRQPLIIHVKD